MSDDEVLCWRRSTVDEFHRRWNEWVDGERSDPPPALGEADAVIDLTRLATAEETVGRLRELAQEYLDAGDEMVVDAPDDDRAIYQRYERAEDALRTALTGANDE